MSNERKLISALGYSGFTQTKLAEALNTSKANLNKKIKRNTLTPEDMQQIADIIGAKYVYYFEFPDGTKI